MKVNRLFWLILFALIILVVESWMLFVPPQRITPLTMRLSRVNWKNENLEHIFSRKIIAIAYAYKAFEFPKLYEAKSPFLSWVQDSSSGLASILAGALMKINGTYDLQLDPWIGWIEFDEKRINKIVAALKKADRNINISGKYPNDGRFMYFICEDNTGSKISYHFKGIQDAQTDRLCAGYGWASSGLLKVLPRRAYWHVPKMCDILAGQPKKGNVQTKPTSRLVPKQDKH